MPNVLDGLSLIDVTGRLILATTLVALVSGVLANLYVRARYRRIEEDLDENGGGQRRFLHPVLNDVTRAAEDAWARSPEPNTQAIIEDGFQAGLRTLLVAERFVRAATGLVIILGLLGTFYGLTSSIGKLVHLISSDAGGVVGVTASVTTGLTDALSGMAVAFSNSLVGVGSAVVLTVLGIFSNPTDRRVALMIRLEAYLDRRLSASEPAAGLSDRTPRGRSGEALERSVTRFGESVERLDAVVARFDSALQTFSTSTRDFTEFNAHLKDNVQRMSLCFGDLSETLKAQSSAIKHRNGQ